MRMSRFIIACTAILLSVTGIALSGQGNSVGNRMDGKRLFERETFGGNGRTCVTCHSLQTGTVSPQDALRRFQADSGDPLFIHDGSDDGLGHGVTRMLRDATVLITIPLSPNLHVAGNPSATSVVLRRGIPTTLDTPALPLPEPLHPQDNIFMLDGRQRSLELQAAGAIHDHAVATVAPSSSDLERIKQFQLTDDFFSSSAVRNYVRGSGPAPGLPEGRTAAEKRGRFFFEDVVDFNDFNHGLCAACHSGPLLNQTNFAFELLTAGAVPQKSRFQDVLVSELNEGRNPVIQLLLNTGSAQIPLPPTPDPGRYLITGNPADFNVFKIPSLRGLTKTAPYFHDNSAKTLEDVVAHYKLFFDIVTTPPEGGPPAIDLSPEDMAAIVAFMKLL